MEDQQTTGATRPTQGRVIALIVGLGLIIVGTVLAMAWGRPPEVPAIIPAAAAQPFNDPARPDGPHNGAETPVQVSLPESYRLNISFGDLGHNSRRPERSITIVLRNSTSRWGSLLPSRKRPF